MTGNPTSGFDADWLQWGPYFSEYVCRGGNALALGGQEAFNSIYLSKNVGVAIGPALAGLIASVSIDYILPANLIFNVVFLFIAFFGYRKLEIAPDRHTNVIKEKKKISQKAPFYALLIISSGYLIMWLVYSQWMTTISTLSLSLGISLKQYSLLWTINGPLFVIGIVIFCISYIVVSFAASFTMFIVAMVIVTFGEMFVWPAVPTIASQLSPKGRKGFYQGIVNSFATMGRMFGPFFGGILAHAYGMQVMLFILTALMIIPIITSLLYDRRVKKAGNQPESHL